jgi:hypothetical protein
MGGWMVGVMAGGTTQPELIPGFFSLNRSVAASAMQGLVITGSKGCKGERGSGCRQSKEL